MLDYASLPLSESIVASNDIFVLRDALDEIFGEDSPIQSVTIAQGGPSSCRVFFVSPHQGDIKEPPRTCEEIAELLLQFGNEEPGGARFPAHKPNMLSLKGWEIRRFDKDGYVGAIATAVWI